jgi:hypothetical protein
MQLSLPFPVMGGDYQDSLSGFGGAALPGANGWYTNFIVDVVPARYSPHGVGCVPAAPATIRLKSPASRAWLGGLMEVEIAPTPQPFALFTMGFSDTNAGATALPLDLSAYGMPGCHLRVAPDVSLLVATAASSAAVQIPIPQWSGLLGVPFWQQGFVLAPGVNLAGLLATDSVRGTIGLR